MPDGVSPENAEVLLVRQDAGDGSDCLGPHRVARQVEGDKVRAGLQAAGKGCKGKEAEQRSAVKREAEEG